ncbi:MAG: class II aldolase/adducin family protein [Candidatus Omnitrophica bacterium]|nr:class II aldolase/adducin family protein [Candidatus Omnitrophota bacterium]
MKPAKENIIKRRIIAIGKKLIDCRLVTARAGNLSARLDAKSILITVTGSELGNLKYSDIVKVSLENGVLAKTKRKPSSELPAHGSIYKNFPCQVVIHCHPPLTNAYFAVLPRLKVLTFETRFYLKEVPVVAQKSLNVTRVDKLIAALRKNKIAVVKNHGVFSIADTFSQALGPILILEEAIKVAAIARLFKKKALDKIDRQIKKCLLNPKAG